MERWKWIEGFEGLYKISDKGRVFSYYIGRVLKLVHDDTGRPKVQLHKNGRSKNYRISRLVAQAFVPNPNNKPEVDHIDTNPSNNNANNLRWVTHKENANNELTIQHFKASNSGKNNPFYGKHHNQEAKRAISIAHSGENSTNARAIICLETKEIFISATEASKKYNRCKSAILACCKGKNKTCAKHHWMFLEEWNNLTTKEQIDMLNKLTYDTHLYGANNSQARAVICLDTLCIYDTITEASKTTKANRVTISACCKGKQKTAGGFYWMYLDEYLEVK